MNRVLLFVQTGDGRPKCVATPGWMGAGAAQHVREMYDGKATPDSPHWIQVLDGADRWWLVECENADEGRRIIGWAQASHGLFTRVVQSNVQSLGRILASGGRP